MLQQRKATFERGKPSVHRFLWLGSRPSLELLNVAIGIGAPWGVGIFRVLRNSLHNIPVCSEFAVFRAENVNNRPAGVLRILRVYQAGFIVMMTSAASGVSSATAPQNSHFLVSC